MVWTIPQRVRRSRTPSLGTTAAEDPAGVRVFLYEAEGEDRELTLEQVDVDGLDGNGLLWIDVQGLEQLELVTTSVGLEAGAGVRIARSAPGPDVVFHPEYFHVSVVLARPTKEGYDAAPLHCVAGANWVVTAHDPPVEFLERFDGRIRGNSVLGRLDAAGLLAVFLHENVASYLREIESFEEELERLDLQVMTGRADDSAVLRRLVAIRRKIARLRRLFAPQRELYGRLARPDFELLSEADSPQSFASLAEFGDQALQALDAAREMTLSSFEIYTMWTSHETNRVMKMLTVASVALLPPTLLASVMGMNSLPSSLVGLPAFAITLSAMTVLLVTVLGAARRRGWL
jgi:Mg2+ and Co2+ transporter CorA